MSWLYILGWILAAGLVLVGIYALLSPHGLASAYGVRTDSHHGAAGFVRATGIRDVVLGAVLGASLYLHYLPLIIVLAIAGIVLSIADLTIAYHHGPEKRLHASHSVHAAGIVAFVLILAMALFALGK